MLMRDLSEFETVLDPSAAAVPSEPAAPPSGGAAPEPDPPAGATEAAAAAFTPDQLAALRDSPEMQEWLATEAASIADARFQQLIDTSRPAPAPPAGQDVNLNEFLDPMGDNFGQNLIAVLGQFAQQMQGGVQQALAPLHEQTVQLQQAENDQLLKTAIADTAQGLGGLKGGDTAVERVMQSVRNHFMPQAMQLYGQTDRAAQVAIANAIRAERDYQQAVFGGTAQQTAEHLAQVAAARTEPAGAGANGLVAVPDTPLGTQARVLKHAALIRAASGR